MPINLKNFTGSSKTKDTSINKKESHSKGVDEPEPKAQKSKEEVHSIVNRLY